MDSNKAAEGTQGATYADRLKEILPEFLRVSYDDRAKLLEGDHTKIYSDGERDYFLLVGLQNILGLDIPVRALRAALYEHGLTESALRIQGKTTRVWCAAVGAFPHPDGRKHISSKTAVAVREKSPYSDLTKLASDDWRCIARNKREEGQLWDTYKNVRTGEIISVLSNGSDAIDVFGVLPVLPPGLYIEDPRHDAKHREWSRLNHEAKWLPQTWYAKWKIMRDRGDGLDELWHALDAFAAEVAELEAIETTDAWWAAATQDEIDLVLAATAEVSEHGIRRFEAGLRFEVVDEAALEAPEEVPALEAPEEVPATAPGGALASLRAAVDAGDPAYV